MSVIELGSMASYHTAYITWYDLHICTAILIFQANQGCSDQIDGTCSYSTSMDSTRQTFDWESFLEPSTMQHYDCGSFEIFPLPIILWTNEHQ